MRLDLADNGVVSQALADKFCRVKFQSFLIHIIVLAARLENTGGFATNWRPQLTENLHE
jgi:hypothetical protein